MFVIVLFQIMAGLAFGGDLPCSDCPDSECFYSSSNYSFKGLPVHQARCLLRPVKPMGNCDDPKGALPKFLGSRVGLKVLIEKDALRKHLAKKSIKEADIGGNLDQGLSYGNSGDEKAGQAKYFVIHDTSTPNCKLKVFPENINEESWIYNSNIKTRWKNNPHCHIFISRMGQSVTIHDFADIPPRAATKLEKPSRLPGGRGLFLHIELIQPRKSDPTKWRNNDVIAPVPGFTDAQYDRLALCYIAAGVRRGHWLIPAYHAVLDRGIKNAHDDPQNFDLDKWADSIKRISMEIGKSKLGDS